MAEQFDVHDIAANIGALSNALQPLFKVPSAGGGITILGAQYTPGASSGTAAPQLVDLGTGGTVVDHVLVDFGTVTASAKIPNVGTLQANVFVDGGHYLGVRENNVGSTPTVSIVGISYVTGK